MPHNAMAKKYAMNIIKKYKGGLVKQMPQDADLLDSYTEEQYLDDIDSEHDQDEDVEYFFEGGEVDSKGASSLRKAFGTTDKNNDYEPEASGMTKLKRLLGMSSSDSSEAPKKLNKGGFVQALKMKRGY